MQQQFSNILSQDTTTYNRENKDFAAWEKQQNDLKKEQKQQNINHKLLLDKQQGDLYRLNMNNEMQDQKTIQKIKQQFAKDHNLEDTSKLNGIQLRNPINQQLLLNDQSLCPKQEHFIQSSLFQGKIRNQDYNDKYQNQSVDQNFLQGKKRIVEPPKAQDQKQMQGKLRNDELISYYAEKSKEEINLFQGKKRLTEHRYQDEQKLMQGKLRNEEQFQNMIGRNCDEQQLFKSKNRIGNNQYQLSEDNPLSKNQDENFIAKKQFQTKKRDTENFSKYLGESQDEQIQFQGKKRIQQQVAIQQEDDLNIQKKKRNEDNPSWKQSDSLQVLMQSKKRDQNQPQQQNEQVLMQSKKRDNQRKDLIEQSNPYINF